MRKTIFFAYESGHQDNIDAIRKGSSEYNLHQKTYHVQTWEDLKTYGTVINTAIFKAINKCDIFACDLTYQNHNVLFELGYAIAKEKKILIFLNETIKGSKNAYSNFKILQAIRYNNFTNSKNISIELQKKVKVCDMLSLSEYVNLQNIECDSYDVFLMNSKNSSQAAIDLADSLNASEYKILTNDSTEIEYQPLRWYLKNLYLSRNIILHMLGPDKINSMEYNAEYSFYAGIGFGFNKKVLLIAPEPFRAPIDYSDILMEYSNSEDCVAKAINWIDSQQLEYISNTKKNIKQDLNDDLNDNKLNLLKLGIGYEIAEEENENLLDYFVEYESYKNAFNRDCSIIVGRKGSGKSALYIKLVNDYLDVNDVYNVTIKPDSEELLENVEFSKLYDNERSKKKFLFTVWEFVFLSKLLKSIVEKITKLNSFDQDKNEIIIFNNDNSEKLNLNFYGVIKLLNVQIKSENIDKEEVLSLIYKEYIEPLKIIIRKYFKENKYKKIHLLCDNLDKTWDAKNDLSLQSDMILALLEFSGKISQIIDNINISTIIFLRDDIYNYILKNSREPDKVTINTSFINWAKYPNKLKQIIEKRFIYSLELKNESSVIEIWDKYFTSDNKAFEEILKCIVYRPRDIIYFVSRLFEYAINSNLDKVDSSCFQYAIEEYSNFLHNNLIAEMKAEYPEINEIMAKIVRQSYGIKINYSVFMGILNSVTKNKDKDYEIFNSLLSKRYIIGLDEKREETYNNADDIIKKENEKKFFFFKKNNIYIKLHPQKNTWKGTYGKTF